MSLFCPVCGLPVVPFGGEDICLDQEHEEDRYESPSFDDEDETDCDCEDCEVRR